MTRRTWSRLLLALQPVFAITLTGCFLFLALLLLFLNPTAASSVGESQPALAKPVLTPPPRATATPQATRVAATVALTYGLDSAFTGLDPALDLNDSAWQVAGQVYETLVSYQTGGLTPTGALAQNWSVSPDGLSWTFTLRPNIKFHDGTDLTASAVVSNFVRWWDPADPHHVSGFDYFANVFGGFKGDAGCMLLSVTTVSPLQVRLVLSQPYSPLPTFLALPSFSIASPVAIQSGTLSTAPVGTGPYRFIAWPTATLVTLAANTSYWGVRAKAQTLTYQSYASYDAKLQALQAGKAQATDFFPVASNSIFPSEYVLAAMADANLSVLWHPSLSVGYLGLNRAHAPLDNVLVRQAIAHAIDKAYLLNTYYNGGGKFGQVATQFLPPIFWGYDNTIADYSYDPAQARSLLTQAGFANGFTTTLMYMPVERAYLPNMLSIGQKIQADLQAAGISATLVTYDWSVYWGKVSAGEADLFMLGWGTDNAHPENFFAPNLCQESTRYGPKDETLCTQLDAARADMNFTSVVSTYQWASRRVHDTLPLIPIGNPRSPSVVRKNVIGFTPSAYGPNLLKDVTYASVWVYMPCVLHP